MRTLKDVLRKQRGERYLNLPPEDYDAAERVLAIVLGGGQGLLDAVVVGLDEGHPVVVTKEAMDRLARLVCSNDALSYSWDEITEDEREGYRESAAALALALFPNGVEVAEAVGTVRYQVRTSDSEVMAYTVEATNGLQHELGTGDRVAVLMPKEVAK